MVTARTLLRDKGDAPKGERDEGRSHRPKKRQRLPRDGDDELLGLQHPALTCRAEIRGWEA